MWYFLGRKSACTVTLSKGGFSLQQVQICEGQVVRFEWDDQEGSGYNITQVYAAEYQKLQEVTRVEYIFKTSIKD